jgi:hypothetical protein
MQGICCLPTNNIFYLETDEERVVRQVVDSDASYTLETDEDNIVRQVYNVEETFALEYEPIPLGDEERHVAVHDGMLNISLFSLE